MYNIYVKINKGVIQYMDKIKLINKPNFLNDNILKDLFIKIYNNNNIKNISKIDFRFKECINHNSLVYVLNIHFNESATFYNDVKLFSGENIIVKGVVFRKDENYKPFLY